MNIARFGLFANGSMIKRTKSRSWGKEKYFK